LEVRRGVGHTRLGGTGDREEVNQKEAQERGGKISTGIFEDGGEMRGWEMSDIFWGEEERKPVRDG